MPKRCQNDTLYKTLDKRQISKENPVNFSDERLIFVLFCLAWCLWGWLLVQQGFGEDTDAWLLAQTAEKLLLGQGYDPARSFGNPVYEFLLVILQPEQVWIWSNLFNLFLSVLFLWRLPLAFPFLKPLEGLILRLSLLAMPIFTEAATSSMEYMLCWWLLLESLLALKSERRKLLYVFVSLACFTRLEFYPLLLFTFWGNVFGEKTAGISLSKPFFVILSVSWLLYLGWAMDKNPSPFTDLESGFRFYAGRIGYLIKQADVLTPIYIYLIIGAIQMKTHDSLFYRLGLGNFLFFILFPFEWAYILPTMVIGLVSRISSFPSHRWWMMPIGILAASLLSWNMKTKFSFQLPSNYSRRKEMTKLYLLAQKAHPRNPTLLLYGATFLPTNTRTWEKAMGNRLFHRKNSYLYVGEKLNKTELDSLLESGFQIYTLTSEKGGFSSKDKRLIWLVENELEELLKGN